MCEKQNERLMLIMTSTSHFSVNYKVIMEP